MAMPGGVLESMIDLNDYFYFVHVVEKQGFTPAARALNMPKSRLSRHVSKLEERLDVKLIQRTSRQFNVTESGQIFYQHARALLEEAEVAEAAIQSRKTALSGRVTMSCSVGVAQFAIRELVLQFLADHPKVELVQLFASPHYLSKTGTPESPYDLFKRQSLKVGWQPVTGH